MYATNNDTLIAHSYNRIVVGDYGAFFQKNKVSYADYKIGKYYVSPWEIKENTND